MSWAYWYVNDVDRYGQTVSETEKYVDKVTSPEEKFDLFVDLQLWRRAFEVALKMKDPARLEEVSEKSFALFVILRNSSASI